MASLSPLLVTSTLTTFRPSMASFTPSQECSFTPSKFYTKPLWMPLTPLLLRGARLATRNNLLLKIADTVEKSLQYLVVGETVRKTLATDLPLVVDHFRYFAGVIRADKETVSGLDKNMVSICFHEPLGVVG